MIKCEDVIEIITDLKEHWGVDVADKVIDTIVKTNNRNYTMDEFFNHCTACGGNWGGMILTGIKELFPAVYTTIPDHMGKYAFGDLCGILTLLGVDDNEC